MVPKNEQKKSLFELISLVPEGLTGPRVSIIGLPPIPPIVFNIGEHGGGDFCRYNIMYAAGLQARPFAANGGLQTPGAKPTFQDGGSLYLSSRRPRIRNLDRQAPQERGPRRNEQIRITPIRLIGAEGEQLGIVPTFEALQKAKEAGLDLVEVAADERPPVCRILDYGKLRFTTSQKGNKASKVRPQKLKEIRVRPKTDDHDIETKVAQARRFLEHNDKVQVTVIFRGREMQHQEEGRRVLDSVLEKLAAAGKVERAPMMDGKKMTALIMPNKSAAKPKPKLAEVKPPVVTAQRPV